MSKLLTICIPTLPIRVEKYAALVIQLRKQIRAEKLENQVQLLTYGDSKEVTIGEKRNWFVRAAKGKYIAWLDDDDRISKSYIPSLVKGCLSNSDCVTFEGEYWENNLKHSDFIISKLVTKDYNEKQLMHRRPNHLCPVRLDIAKLCPFPHKQVSEDSAYSEQVNKHIKTSFHIKEKLYFYMHSHSETQTQNTKSTLGAF
jgi:glycosyltransferase involved in cell wall biosynthesis